MAIYGDEKDRKFCFFIDIYHNIKGNKKETYIQILFFSISKKLMVKIVVISVEASSIVFSH